jgi:8-oxo-dGTP pyrophosphatase MutT (NUDIX family)
MLDLPAVRRLLAQHRPVHVDEPGTLPAAVAIALLPGEHGLEALFIERAERANDPWSRQIAFPGGRRDARDTDLLDTAVRETWEETGVELNRAQMLGSLDDLHPRTPVLPPVVVRPFVFGLGSRPAIVSSVEVQEAFWIPLARLRAPGTYREVTVTPRGLTLTVPAYVIGERVIWGMTERIVTPMLALLGI